ncbi:MAG: hypothetical protein V3S71_02830, partial [Acidobacteriota bacterium]
MKLVIDNRTHWRKDDLRKLIRAALENEGMDGYYNVRVAYARHGGGCGGWGFYNIQSMMMALPKHVDNKTVDELPERLVLAAARVLEHEIAHNRG